MMLYVVEHPTRYLFFTGKGGVGKTSLATATSVSLADRGRRVLLVSTDPASNLGQVLECAVGETITPVARVHRLSTLNIDPGAAAAAYRERVVGPVRGALPDDVVAQMEESLSGACTTEIAAFDEFTKLLTDTALTTGFDHIVFDTAPTGHTLRLLQLPGAWSRFIDANPGGASCLGPLSGLEAQRAQYATAVRSLSDPAVTTLLLVTRPEPSRARRGEPDERRAVCDRDRQPAPRRQWHVRGARRGGSAGRGARAACDGCAARHAVEPARHSTRNGRIACTQPGRRVGASLAAGRG